MIINREDHSNEMRVHLAKVWSKHEIELSQFEESFIDSILKHDRVMSEKQWKVAKRIVEKHLAMKVNDGSPEEAERPRRHRGAMVRR